MGCRVREEGGGPEVGQSNGTVEEQGKGGEQWQFGYFVTGAVLVIESLLTYHLHVHVCMAFRYVNG